MVVPPVAIDVPLRTDAHGKLRVGGTRVLLNLSFTLSSRAKRRRASWTAILP